MALDEDIFLPAPFRKVRKIRKGLKSNGTSHNTRFKENNSRHLDKTGRTALVWAFFCLHFTPMSGPLLVGFLSPSLDTPSGSLHSGIHCTL